MTKEDEDEAANDEDENAGSSRGPRFARTFGADAFSFLFVFANLSDHPSGWRGLQKNFFFSLPELFLTYVALRVGAVSIEFG